MSAAERPDRKGGTGNPCVSGLFIHPIKSCRAQSIQSAAFDHFGFVDDRRWLVVDDSGRFLTQRTEPRLALITAELSENRHRLCLTAPGSKRHEVALDASAAPTTEVVIWHDTVAACDLGDDAAWWLTAHLRRSVRLVAMAPGYSRPVRRHAQAGDEVAFVDGYPLLIISRATLDELNQRLDVPVPMDRFRPNVVIDGCAAGDEDLWQRIRIGDCVLRAAGPCIRCVVTTTDQSTLERGKEPLRTLGTYRRVEGGVCFGSNYIHETKAGTISVGMPVEVLDVCPE